MLNGSRVKGIRLDRYLDQHLDGYLFEIPIDARSELDHHSVDRQLSVDRLICIDRKLVDSRAPIVDLDVDRRSLEGRSRISIDRGIDRHSTADAFS